MAKADFCFNFYDGDATRDMAHMNRLERGAYTDVIIQQRQRGHLSLNDLKKFLSKDFDAVWPALEWILKKDAAGLFFIEWLENSEKKAKAHSVKQKENRAKALNKEPKRNQPPTKRQPKTKSGQPSVEPLGNGDGNENGLKKNKNESDRDFYEPDIQGEEIFFPIDTPAMRNLWAAWKQHRWKNFNTAYGMMGEQAALKQLEGLDFHQARSAIQQAISSNWKNLYPEKNGQGKSFNDSKSRIEQIIKNRNYSGGTG